MTWSVSLREERKKSRKGGDRERHRVGRGDREREEGRDRERRRGSDREREREWNRERGMPSHFFGSNSLFVIV